MSAAVWHETQWADTTGAPRSRGGGTPRQRRGATRRTDDSGPADTIATPQGAAVGAAGVA